MARLEGKVAIITGAARAQGEATARAFAAEVVEATLAAFGRLDILINNAGILSRVPTLELSVAEFRRVLDVNLIGAFLGTRTVAPVMAETGGGAIVNISSIQGMVGRAGTPAYTASKFGLRGLTKTMALELGPLGIRINSVHPGGVDTEMIHEPTAGVAYDTDALDRGHAQLPIPRVGQPEDIAMTSLFLASDEAAYITGTEVVVDGGLLAGYMPREP